MNNGVDLLAQQSSRVPPQAPEVEEALLGSMITDPGALTIAVQSVKADDMYKPEHRQIFAAIYDLYDGNNPVDFTSLENKLNQMSAQYGGPDRLADLTRLASPGSVDYHCQIIIEKSKARKTIEKLHSVIDQAYKPDADIFALLEDSERFVYETITDEKQNNMASLDVVMNESLDYILSIQGADGGIIGIPSGLDYDKITSGWQKGKLYTIAGRPGMGKTAYMLHNLKYACQNGASVGVISLEMGRRALGTRLMLSEAGVDNQSAMQGRLTDDEITRVKKAADRLRSMGMVIDDTTVLTPALLRIKARMMKQLHNIGLLAVDYIQLMHSEGKTSREQEVAEISRTCKLLSKELDIPVLALAQLSREPDKRQGEKTRPQLSDLRESGAIEQDSDVVIFLWRPEYYKIETFTSGPRSGESTEGVTELDIAKQREGPTGVKMIYFNKKTMSFENLAPPHRSHEHPAPHVLEEDDLDW